MRSSLNLSQKAILFFGEIFYDKITLRHTVTTYTKNKEVILKDMEHH